MHNCCTCAHMLHARRSAAVSQVQAGESWRQRTLASAHLQVQSDGQAGHSAHSAVQRGLVGRLWQGQLPWLQPHSKSQQGWLCTEGHCRAAGCHTASWEACRAALAGPTGVHYSCSVAQEQLQSAGLWPALGREQPAGRDSMVSPSPRRASSHHMAEKCISATSSGVSVIRCRCWLLVCS